MDYSPNRISKHPRLHVACSDFHYSTLEEAPCPFHCLSLKRNSRKSLRVTIVYHARAALPPACASNTIKQRQ
eukprot:1557558-Amphidinium_carterae.1